MFYEFIFEKSVVFAFNIAFIEDKFANAEVLKKILKMILLGHNY